jgi:hypothetical protein
MTLSIATLCTDRHYADAEGRVLCIVMLNVIMLDVVILSAAGATPGHPA